MSNCKKWLFNWIKLQGKSGIEPTAIDNILQSCITATSYTGVKNLLGLGFSSTYYPSADIQALPHYNDFISAGWAIGY